MLRIALPKGSLEEQTMELFRQADLEMVKWDRQYNPTIDDPRISKVKILRPQEIPTYVSQGHFDIGISGFDCVIEFGADVEMIADLPYSKTGPGNMKMVIAVPYDSPWEKPEDIPDGSRITTEFPNITGKYFEDMGKNLDISYSFGATEAKIPELMDALVDLTETGSTLKRNQLKIIGIIMESCTKLIANKDSWADPEKRRAIEEIKTLLLGVIEARGKVLLTMNVSAADLEKVVDGLPSMKKPTLSKLHESDYYSLQTVVEKRGVNVLIPRLKALGAEDILEIDIHKIVR